MMSEKIVDATFGALLPDQYKGEPPDHISFELDFMSFLCDKEAEAWKNKDSKEALKFLNLEKDFLDNHLTRWVHSFCNKIIDAGRSGFYRGVAKITSGFIKFDHAQIETYKQIAENNGVDLG